jgi:GNAT superfamily N-acetyltransferase
MITIPLIRAATRADRDALRALQETAMRELARPYYDADVIEGFIRHIGTMDDVLIDDGTYFAAFVDGTLAGCGGWTARMPGYMTHAASDALFPLRPTATVRSVFVHPSFARRGLARRIMARVEAEIAKAGYDRAGLAATLSGLPLYRRIGYRSAEPVVLRMPEGLALITVRMHKRFAHARIAELAPAA